MGNTLQSEITQQDIDKWVRRAYDTACNHGFHDKEYSDAHWLMLIVTEIAEAVEADRRGIHASPDDVLNLYEDRYMLKRFLFERCVKETVEDELADICIRIFDFAGLRKLELHPIDESQNLLIMESNIRTLSFTDFMFMLTGRVHSYYTENTNLSVVIGGIIVYCNIHGIDLKKHIELKMKYNELRPIKNGKSY